MRLDRLVVPIGALVIVSGLVVAVVVGLRPRQAPPIPANAPPAAPAVSHVDLIVLKNEAESLATQGRFSEALDKYQKLETLTLERQARGQLKDSQMWEVLIEGPRLEKQRIMTILLARQAGPLTQRTLHVDLIAIKNDAEMLAIEGKLPEARDKFARLLALAQSRLAGGGADDQLLKDLLENAQASLDEIDKVLARRGPPTPPATMPARGVDDLAPAATAPSTPVAGRPATLPATLPQVAATRPGHLASLKQPTRFTVVRTPRDPVHFDDAMVGQSLAQAAAFLVAQFKDGEIQEGRDVSEMHRRGLNALCVYALLSAGKANRDPQLAITSPFMRDLIDKMKRHAMAVDREQTLQPVVYARSLRAAALALHDHPEDRDVLWDDVAWLINAAQEGAYSYDDRFNVNRVADPRIRIPRGMDEKRGATRPVWPWEQDPRKFRKLMPDPSSLRISPGPLLDDDGRPYMLADGRHDPRTGRELDPPFRIRLFPPSPPPMYVPQMPVEKYTGVFTWDNSNSQYGVMGVEAGARAGIEVPEGYWMAVQKHWLSCQLPTGEWPYRADRPGGYLAMTGGGIASLLITRERVEGPVILKSGRQPTAAGKSIDQAMAWLETDDNAIEVAGPRTVYLGYNLHVLSRVGLATGYKFFGKNDWYRDLSKKIVLSQWENGSWGKTADPESNTLINTAYTMLFLSLGRHPVMMNKLRLDTTAKDARGKTVITDRGQWNNRPHDLANLARFASAQLERDLNWQIVPIDREAADWSDAPILYLASHQSLKLSDAEVARIRQFVDEGGLLFTHSDQSEVVFNLFTEQLASRLFPGQELKDLPVDHEIYSALHQIAPTKRVRLRGISGGSRLLWVHSPTDVSLAWEQRASHTRRELFELGVNLFVYAAGKTDLRNRIDDRHIPKPSIPPTATLKLARLKYPGVWDPEPQAIARFSRYLQWETGVALDVRPVEMSQLKAGTAAIAHLCGTSRYTPTAAELAALRGFVEGGGTLVVEPVGGVENTFAESAQTEILKQAFPSAKFDALTSEHPLLRATFVGTEDLWPPRLRPYATQKLGQQVPPIRVASIGKGRVIYLPLDMTTGLLGCGTWPILGYEPSEALAMMKNIVLWSFENSAGK